MTVMNLNHDPQILAVAPQEALQEALGQFPGIVWTTDTQSVITSAYGAGLTALGLKPNQTVGMSLAEYFQTDDPHFPVLAAHRRVMLGDLRTMSMQWEGREFETRMQPLRNASGAVTGCLGIAYDVTERNRSARVLPEYVAQMRAGVERAPDFIFHVDRAGTMTYAESSLPDYQPNLVIGTKVAQWLRPETMAIVEQAMQRVFVDRQPQHIEIPAPGAGSPDRWYDVRLRPVLEKEQAVGLAAVAYDITERKLVELRLREQVELLAQVLANIPRGVLWKGRDGTYLGCNETFTRFVGLNHPRDVIGRRDEELPVAQGMKDWLRESDEEVLEKEFSKLDIEKTFSREDGAVVTLSATKVPLRDSAGKTVGVLGTLVDVTQRKKWEQELREAREELERRVMQRTDELTAANKRLRDEEGRLQSILDNSTAIVYVKDAAGRFTLVNSQFCKLFHISAEEVVGKYDAEVFPPEIAAKFRANDLQVQAERRAIQFEEVAPHDEGPHHYISVKFPIGESPDGSCSVCGISTDITDRKVSEERLRNEERLMRRLLELRERERMLLAYDIHDGLVQDIVGAKMLLEGQGSELEDGAQLDATTYQQVLHLLVQAIDEGRRMISELRPPILDEQGIIGSIEYLVAEQLQKSGCRIRFRHHVTFDRLSPLLEQTVFRIVQEALNNVARHSSAPEAEVNLSQTGQRIRIEIRDRGVGFDPAGVSSARFGLRGIIERARLFGGNATIDSRPGEGTCIVVEVPINQDGPSE
ncbi:MAG: PAS domain-containing protein [Planctomycetes bacterium]|nr:PAS domain-containing protein [Planctomycetota bacterium]